MMNFKEIFILQFILFKTFIDASYNQYDYYENFGYEGAIGPEHWGAHYGQCNGKLQSPISINDINVEHRHQDDIIYQGFNEIPIRGKISNNGHTGIVHLIYETNMAPLIRKGPLSDKGEFVFEQLHFHWGANNSVGSEGHINGKSFVGELHVVFRNNQYKTFEEAINHHYGIVVLACFFKLQNETNTYYKEFINTLEQIIEPGTEAFLPQPLPSLLNIMDTDLTKYYTYIGSLTTPPCTEQVIWIDFIDPVPITIEVIENFRKLKTFNNTYLTHNFRPIQPLNNRTVYKVVPNMDVFTDSGVRFYAKQNTILHKYLFVTITIKYFIYKYEY